MKDLIQYVNEKLNLDDENINENFEFVDLGLPSGTLWAICNVGAEEPWQFGKYFSWGDKTSKKHFAYKDYKFYKDGGYTKYNETDGKTELDTVNDMAYSNYIVKSCLPTPDQVKELLTCVKYQMVSKYKDHKVGGFLFTANNGNELFFPCAGYYGSFGLDDVGDLCILPTNSLAPSRDDYEYACVLSNINGGNQQNTLSIGALSRYCGTPVRGVKKV